MTLAGDALDLGRLLAWAARPRETPARHDDYHQVVTRYLQDPDFASAADAMFTGAGLRVVVTATDGVIVTAEATSSLRLTAGDVMKRAQPQHRAVVGAVVLAVARTAYPEPSMLNDPDRVAVFTAQTVVDTLDRAAQAHEERSERDGDLDDDSVEMWRRWQAIAPARPNARRKSVSDRQGVVARVCRILADAGYLTARGETDGGTWMSRPRFRYAVAELCADSELYALVNGIAEHPPDEPGTGRPGGEGETDGGNDSGTDRDHDGQG
ncbi:hypothetical protein I6A84_11790 [Frankia sp. CNm7]|uniref:Uncharacterized protein n=1 Tax=Frankia nepalensis TaxID=1836974 RepID=A0A937RIB4_9ACTN|nr:hypothetical protein [Frankia nepalensis]MBL7500561.1 hypothetical protein [Frankia nepalensis]MBL7509745.1 hypothetical protein [Frankia nepalensis]MBL7518774.1 hypothetical protein [Frankia nepalensis]MBL7627864.1 hypothetical protein [Frankia nepalensis]